jgi:putative membrane protein
MRFLNGCGFGGGGFAVMIVPLLLIGLAIYAVYKISANNGSTRNNDSSLEILNERFVNGEINEDEYKRKKALILKH